MRQSSRAELRLFPETYQRNANAGDVGIDINFFAGHPNGHHFGKPVDCGGAVLAR
jgi:hypothetical protein